MKKMFCLVLMIVGILLLTVPPTSADCPDLEILCVKVEQGKATMPEVGLFHIGTCWNASKLDCIACNPSDTDVALARSCNSRYSDCKGACAMCYFKGGGFLAGKYVCKDSVGRDVDASNLNK